MQLPRVRFTLSLSQMMVVVVVASINFAAARASFAHSLSLLIGVAPIGLALQVGLFRLIRSRNQTRMFWVGFVAFGSMVMTSFVWGMLDPPTGRPSYGRMIFPSYPGSTMWTLWEGYFQFAVTSLKPLPGSHQILGISGEIPVATMAVIWFLPQLFIAVVGGVLTGLIGRWWGKEPAGQSVSAKITIEPDPPEPK